MVFVVPSGQTNQLVGLPPLSDETYAKLDKTMRRIYAEYKQLGSPDPSDYYTI
jgi:hypothetical protein